MKLRDSSNDMAQDTILNESFRALTEAVNPSNHYDFEKERRNMWTFLDKSGIKHFIIFHKDLVNLSENRGEVKFGWVDENTQKPRYDIPPQYDERVYNTHLYVFLNEILPHFSKFINGIILKPTDTRRYRLYRMSLNKFLDKQKYELVDEDDRLIITVMGQEFIPDEDDE